jgi:DNA-binding response OmpR family regulator
VKKILVVDDDRDFSFFLKKNLEKRDGYHISVCNESVNAIAAIKKLRPDLVLLDIMMPDKSGIDIAAELKSDKSLRNIPVIFLTSIIKEDELEKQKNVLGEGTYVPKVIETEKLLSIVENAMDNAPQPGLEPKERTRIVTFLSRGQIDFLDKLGKDSMFHKGSKLSRTETLSELVTLLMELGIDIKDIDLKNGLARGILQKLGR